jgi:hypothetical protein
MMPIEYSFGAGTSPRFSTNDRDFQGSRASDVEQPTRRAPRREFRFGALAAALVTIGTAPAAATEALAVQLEIRRCGFLVESEVARVVRAELGVDPVADPGSEPTQILAQCEGERLLLEVIDPVSRKFLRRNFALREPEHPGMSRLVGIAAAELVLASWAELSLNPTPTIEPEGKPAPKGLADQARARVKRRAETASRPALAGARASAPPVEGGPSLAELPPDDGERTRQWSDPPPRDGGRLRVVALASRRAFFTNPGALWGGGARVGSEPLANTSWALDALFESGTVNARRGAFRIDTFTLGGQLFLAGRLSIATFRVGGGLRAGFSSASGNSAGGGASTGAVAPWGWPLAATNVGFQLGPKLVLELSAEASYVALPISTGATGETLRGTWFSAQLGLGVVP